MSDGFTPTHLGLILDGNRRWAKAKGLPQFEGHRKGYENIKIVGRAALAKGVKFVTVYVFSTENWNRSKEEVDYLMKLLLWVAKHEVNELHRDNIRVKFLGTTEKLPAKILTAINVAEEKTRNNTAGTLALCLNYGGQQEIVDTVNKILTTRPTPKHVTKKIIEQNLYAPEIPPIDLLIRTSGEQRISNFMLWRVAYSELYFVKKHWPDFTVSDLDEALDVYAKRERRFGS